MVHIIARVGEQLARVEWFMIGLLLAALTGVTVLQVISRNTGIFISWVEDVAMLLLLWKVLLGSALAIRYGGHYTVDVFGTLPNGVELGLRSLSAVVVAIILIVLLWKGIELGWRLRFRLSGAAELPMSVYYAAFPTAAVLGAFHLIEALLTRPRFPEAHGQP